MSRASSCPKPSFISLSARVLVNIEAMNMVEALGNVVRHRKASAIYRVSQNRYELRTVPVISGEAVRHAIQAALADIAASKGLNVCEWCRRHEFIKHGVRPLLGDLEEKLKGSPADAEKIIVEGCVVEDVGGFLVPLETPVKRTSVLEVGYMMPVIQGERVMYGFDVQFHARHAPNAQQKLAEGKTAGREQREQAQSVYNVESSSALYSLGLNVELWRIGTVVKDNGCDVVSNRKERVEATLAALIAVLNGDVRIGGHWSSYKPLWILESAVAVFSKPMPISAMPAVEEGYEEASVKLAKSKAELYKRLFDVEYKVLVYKKEEAASHDDVEYVKDVGDFLKKLFDFGVEYADIAER